MYLSSYRIPVSNQLFKLVGKTSGEVKTAVIPNAKDYYSLRARNYKIKETNQYLAGLGLNPSTFDLKNCNNVAKIKAKLQRFDLIWVSGGNTFCLRHQMRRSGFDQVVKELLNQDSIVYAGESAGACVTGNSLKGLEDSDTPQFAEEIIWEGLNILPNFVLPHTDNPVFAQDTQKARQIHKNDESPVIELKDSQALVINGGNSKIVEKSHE